MTTPTTNSIHRVASLVVHLNHHIQVDAHTATSLVCRCRYDAIALSTIEIQRNNTLNQHAIQRVVCFRSLGNLIKDRRMVRASNLEGKIVESDFVVFFVAKELQVGKVTSISIAAAHYKLNSFGYIYDVGFTLRWNERKNIYEQLENDEKWV